MSMTDNLSARECLTKAEAALDAKDYVDANHYLANFWCQRLNKNYPLGDLDEQWQVISKRVENEMNLMQFLDKAQTYLDANNPGGAEDLILTYAELRRSGVPAPEGGDERYSLLSERLLS